MDTQETHTVRKTWTIPVQEIVDKFNLAAPKGGFFVAVIDTDQFGDKQLQLSVEYTYNAPKQA